MDCSRGECPERLRARPQHQMQARVIAAPITPQTLATTPTTSPFDAKYTSQQLSPPNISNQAMSEYPSTSRAQDAADIRYPEDLGQHECDPANEFNGQVKFSRRSVVVGPLTSYSAPASVHPQFAFEQAHHVHVVVLAELVHGLALRHLELEANLLVDVKAAGVVRIHIELNSVEIHHLESKAAQGPHGIGSIAAIPESLFANGDAENCAATLRAGVLQAAAANHLTVERLDSKADMGVVWVRHVFDEFALCLVGKRVAQGEVLSHGRIVEPAVQERLVFGFAGAETYEATFVG